MPASSSKSEKKAKVDKKFLKELKKKEKRRKKAKDVEREKEKKRAKYKSESSSSSDSDGSDMDLDKEIFPISHYINDRDEMINQVFKTINGSKLRSMLPPALVDLDEDDIKTICLDQLIGMSKRRLQHVLAGQEMLESSGSDSDSEGENGSKPGDSDSGEDAFQSIMKNELKGPMKRSHKIAFGKKNEDQLPVKKVILSTSKTTEHGRSKKEENEKEEDTEQGRTLMELLELEMRARAIKALLMKAGKEEGEAETLAIEEALDEAKKKEQGKEEKMEKLPTLVEKRNVRKRDDDSDGEEKNKIEKNEENDEKKEKVETVKPSDDRVFNSENKAMNKAREMLMLSENKKLIQDEIKSRKEQEALFMYEEQMRKEQLDKERLEKEILTEEVTKRRKALIEKEQEERRKILEKEREKMIEDHKRKEEMKKNRDKEKLFSKIRQMKEAEEKEKEELENHHKTKMSRKRIEREDEGEVEDKDEEGKLRRYRKKDGETAGISENDEIEERKEDQSTVRKPYQRENVSDKKRKDDEIKLGKIRPKKKVEGGSDVEDGEVEEVDSDVEDEIDREDDHKALLQKMKNLRNKISNKMVSDDSPALEAAAEVSGRGRARARGRGGKGRGRGDGEDNSWSLKKYDFEAPDMEEQIKDHKPNFVKAPRRVFEKHDGYYSHSDEETDQIQNEEKQEIISDGKSQEMEEEKGEPSKKRDNFKKVTREEWNKMTRIEKKKYLSERKKRKIKETVYIKDDSDNEQLISSGSEGEIELELSSSEDEKDKEERLAKVALKSYAKSFTATEHPEDYKLVMRKDVWDKELAQDADEGPETLEDIELRDKREKVESKEKTKQEKIRAERLRRMQAFQASSVLRSQPDEEDATEEEEAEKAQSEDENNPFYTSYKEAIEGEDKDKVEDPLKEDRLKRQKEIEEDEAALKAMEEKRGDESKQAVQIKAREEAMKRKIAEVALIKSRKRGDPNNPCKEEVDAQQELEQQTWEDRWKNDAKMKEVFTSSKLVSKAKLKMKVTVAAGEEKKEKETIQESTSSKPVDIPSVEALPGRIGSVDEYANILGKSVKELTEEKFQPPEVSDSEGEESPTEDDGEDLWGKIMGGSENH
ncbi:trichohyalin [Eurytemora carolleeae]|uniref:trichohyalin n=1 Tax=Eurytemora carolleeae TaxID=1294199 RepID=UPI000C77485D|nr:trichohyalin [Eurytemora carolleeae]|eukprot:XP_023336267.1 trichohyalin-like [Eurytemora affinis]